MYPINPEHRDLVDLIVTQHQAQIRADVRTARQQGALRIHPAAAILIIVVAMFIISVTSTAAASLSPPENPGIRCPFFHSLAGASQRCPALAVWSIDTDEDGLSDGVEIYILQTNPRERDTDDDHLSDYNEVVHFGTDPRMKDTDGDGVDDFLEFAVDPPPTGWEYA
jgi:hypothetical protein